MEYCVPEQLQQLLQQLQHSVISMDSEELSMVDQQVRVWFEQRRSLPETEVQAQRVYSFYQELLQQMQQVHTERAEKARSQLRSARALWSGGYRKGDRSV